VVRDNRDRGAFQAGQWSGFQYLRTKSMTKIERAKTAIPHQDMRNLSCRAWFSSPRGATNSKRRPELLRIRRNSHGIARAIENLRGVQLSLVPRPNPCVYCLRCETKLKDFPTPVSRKRQGRRPVRKALANVWAVPTETEGALSAALQLPMTWESIDPPQVIHENKRRCGQRPAEQPAIKQPAKAAAEPIVSLGFYRMHTEKTLRRCLYCSMQVGRARQQYSEIRLGGDGLRAGQ